MGSMNPYYDPSCTSQLLLQQCNVADASFQVTELPNYSRKIEVPIWGPGNWPAPDHHSLAHLDNEARRRVKGSKEFLDYIEKLNQDFGTGILAPPNNAVNWEAVRQKVMAGNTLSFGRSRVSFQDSTALRKSYDLRRYNLLDAVYPCGGEPGALTQLQVLEALPRWIVRQEYWIFPECLFGSLPCEILLMYTRAFDFVGRFDHINESIAGFQKEKAAVSKKRMAQIIVSLMQERADFQAEGIKPGPIRDIEPLRTDEWIPISSNGEGYEVSLAAVVKHQRCIMLQILNHLGYNA